MARAGCRGVFGALNTLKCGFLFGDVEAGEGVEELFFGEGANGEGFAFGALAANDEDVALGEVEGFGEEFDEFVVGGAVDGRGLDGDFECAVVDFEDFVAAGAGGELDANGEAGGGFGDGWHNKS